MNKKFLVALPLAGMFLASCGGAKTALPKGYKVMNDVEDETQLQAFGTKVAGVVNDSYKALFDGVKVSLDVSAKHVRWEDKYLSGDEGKETECTDYVDVKNFGFTFEIGAAKLTGDPNEWQAYVKLNNLRAKVDLQFGDLKVAVNVKDADFGVYLNKGNIYVDLADKGLLDAVKDAGTETLLAIKAMEAADEEEIEGEGGEEEEKPYALSNEQIKKNVAALVDLVGGQYYVEDALEMLGVEDMLPEGGLEVYKTLLEEEPELSKGVRQSIVKEIAGYVANFLPTLDGMFEGEGNPMAFLKDTITVADYDDARVGIGFDATADKNVVGDNATISGDAQAALLANKKGLISSLGVAANITYEEKLGESETMKVEVEKASVSLDIKYGVKRLAMPGFSNYELIPVGLALLLELF